MNFTIVMGVPDMLAYWEDLQGKFINASGNKNDQKLYKLLRKTLLQISANPKHPGLHTHEIGALSARYGQKVFQSYCENRNPRGMRVYWVYGPEKNFITIIGLEPHPNDSKSNAYQKIRLSNAGEIEP